jgi:hypothetical protein
MSRGKVISTRRGASYREIAGMDVAFYPRFCHRSAAARIRRKFLRDNGDIPSFLVNVPGSSPVPFYRFDPRRRRASPGRSVMALKTMKFPQPRIHSDEYERDSICGKTS